tara:strand:- start:6215 stop:7603 length:1389 start_codon:yes stop_codon:yes gene_type:complete
MQMKNYTERTNFDLPCQQYKSLSITLPTKKSKTISFLKELYTYPPKLNIIWEQLDELTPGEYISTTRKSILQFTDKKSSLNNYKTAYLNKVNTSQFYKTKLRPLSDALQSIPIYLVVNGTGEIVVANSNLSQAGRLNKLGLFFLTRTDAECYLTEIAKTDLQGTNKLGLSIHCIGLNSAYKLLREQTSNIDFRIIPSLDEMGHLFKVIKQGDSRFVFDIEQNQSHVTHPEIKSPINWFNGYRTLEQVVSPFNLINQSEKYFKGVPIYIVQVRNTPRNLLFTGILNLFSLADSGYVMLNDVPLKATKILGIDSTIMESQVKKFTNSNDLTTYVCFTKEQAINLVHKFGRRVSRYPGAREQTSWLASFSRIPKIYVHNLEDFFEIWEESVLSDQLENTLISKVNQAGKDTTIQNVHFIPSDREIQNLDEFANTARRSPVKAVSQFVRIKSRILIGFFGTFLNNN